MMRATIVATCLLALFCLPAAAAQDVPLCGSDIPVLGPGLAVPAHAVPSFRWSAEPGGTATRELVITSTGDPALSRLGKVEAFGARVAIEKGSYVWFVTFRDARGRPICRTAVASLVVGQRGATTMASLAGAESAAIATSAPTIYIDADGRYVIVLQDSRYTGPYTERIASDDYDGRSYALGSAIGLVIHGNDRDNNKVWGSAGNDIIILYDGNDVADGGPGDDEIHGGRGNDSLVDPTGGDADVFYGGPGADGISMLDGDANDTAYFGSSGGGSFAPDLGDNYSFAPDGIVDP